MAQGYADLDAPHFHYEMSAVPGLPRRWRGPIPDFDRPFFACLGAAQTFGRFCKRPFPEQCGDLLGVPALNLGHGGIGPGFFLDPAFRRVLERAELVVVQMLSGRSASNSEFLNENGGAFGRRLRDGNEMRFEKFLQEEFDNRPTEELLRIVEETRQRFTVQMKSLVRSIQAPTILLWISEQPPRTEDDISRFWKLMGRFPHLVNRTMVDEIAAEADALVECSSDEHVPQKLWPGTESIDGAVAEEGFLWNRYYPPPQHHDEIAAALAPVCAKLLGRNT